MRPAPIRTTNRRDLRLATAIVRRRPRANGVALRVVIEAKRQPHITLSQSCALIEHESAWRNIFGCDTGGPFCHQKVTRARVQDLIRHVRAGGISNGIGDTQLTWIGYITEAEHDGGAHIRRVNIATGLNILDGHVRRHGWLGGLSVYNSGDPVKALHTYARPVNELAREWHAYFQRLNLT